MAIGWLTSSSTCLCCTAPPCKWSDRKYRHWSSLIPDEHQVETSHLRAAVAKLNHSPDTDIAGVVAAVKAGQKLPHVDLPRNDETRWPPPGYSRYGGKLA
jgi:hypothetical protein